MCLWVASSSLQIRPCTAGGWQSKQEARQPCALKPLLLMVPCPWNRAAVPVSTVYSVIRECAPVPIRTTTDSEFARGRLYVLFEVIFLLWKVSLTLVVHDTQLGLVRFVFSAGPRPSAGRWPPPAPGFERGARASSPVGTSAHPNETLFPMTPTPTRGHCSLAFGWSYWPII
jgi:hypothetical protein